MIVLIVEDESAVAELWRRYLEGVASELRMVHSLAEALAEMARRPNPDLVLLDLRLPDSRDPQHTLAAIQQLKALNDRAVVVVITGAVQEKLPELAGALGADAFACKRDHATQSKLLCVVRDAIQRRIGAKGPVFEKSLSVLEKLSALTTMDPVASSASE